MSSEGWAVQCCALQGQVGDVDGRTWWKVLVVCWRPVFSECLWWPCSFLCGFLWPLLSIRALAHHFHAEACKAVVRKASVPALGRGIWGTGAEGGSCLSWARTLRCWTPTAVVRGLVPLASRDVSSTCHPNVAPSLGQDCIFIILSNIYLALSRTRWIIWGCVGKQGLKNSCAEPCNKLRTWVVHQKFWGFIFPEFHQPCKQSQCDLWLCVMFLWNLQDFDIKFSWL